MGLTSGLVCPESGVNLGAGMEGKAPEYLNWVPLQEPEDKKEVVQRQIYMYWGEEAIIPQTAHLTPLT